MKDGFSSYHPAANLIFFVSVMAMVMVTDDPVIIAISLVGALMYACQLKGRAMVQVAAAGALPAALFMAVINPLFNHQGVTPIFYMPGGNAFTAEALLFGICAGIKLAAMVMWFYCFNAVVKSDKIIYLFGRVSPYFALALSLILGFVPVIRDKFRMCYAAQLQFGAGRLMTVSRCFLATAGWAIEEAADTAASMNSRGFGLKGRTSFTLFVMERKDRIFTALCLIGFASLMAMYFTGAFDFYFYPYVKSFGNGMRIAGCIIYGLLCLMPEVVYLKERRRDE